MSQQKQLLKQELTVSEILRIPSWKTTLYAYEFNIQLIGLGISTIPRRINDVYFQNIEDKLFAITRSESQSEDEIQEKTILEATN